MGRPDPNRRALVALAGVAAVSAALGAALVVGASYARPAPAVAARPADARTLLIGIGCGPEKRVMTAREEDELPACDRIESHWTPQ